MTLSYFSEEVGIDKIKVGLPLKVEVGSTNEFSGGEFKSTVSDVMGDTIKAGMPSLKGRFIPIPVGMMARLSAIDQGSVYVFYAVSVENVEEEKIPITVFKMRSKIRRVQRRRFLRIEYVAKGTFKVAGTDEIQEFMTRDISAGGMRILTKSKIDLGQIAIFNMILEEDVKIQEQQGQFVREIPTESSDLREYGVSFLNVPSSLEDRITRFAFKLELKLRGGKED